MMKLPKIFSLGQQKSAIFGSTSAFALPTLVITATILMIAGASVAQTTVSISSSIRAQNWQHVADEAARAGVSYATSCLNKNGASYWTSALKPNTDCSGGSNGGSAYIKDKAAAGDAPHWRSSFSVSVPSGGQATSEGKVELLDASSNVIKTWVADKKVVITAGGNSGGVEQLSVGGYHMCGIIKSKAYCWGRNQFGQLGNNTTTDSHVPVAVDTSGVLNGKTVTAIAAGNVNSCAVADGKVYCWGGNGNGQLGDGTTTDRHAPVAVNTGGVLSGKVVTDVVSSYSHTCVLASSKVYCWGLGFSGQLGNGTSPTHSLIPVAVYTGGALSGKTVTAIADDNSTTCAIANGQAYCWGWNQFGQLGNGSTTDSSVPVAVYAGGVLSGKTVTAIGLRGNGACAVANGKVYCWGSNTHGQLGNNSTTESHIPVAVYAGGVLSGKTVTSVGDKGDAGTCAIANGKVYCWGHGARGKLGNGTTTDSHVPVAVDTSGVLNNKSITSIATGLWNCAVADGNAYCWGRNDWGGLGNNTTTDSHVPVAVTLP